MCGTISILEVRDQMRANSRQSFITHAVTVKSPQYFGILFITHRAETEQSKISFFYFQQLKKELCWLALSPGRDASPRRKINKTNSDAEEIFSSNPSVFVNNNTTIDCRHTRKIINFFIINSRTFWKYKDFLFDILCPSYLPESMIMTVSVL